MTRDAPVVGHSVPHCTCTRHPWFKERNGRLELAGVFEQLRDNFVAAVFPKSVVYG